MKNIYSIGMYLYGLLLLLGAVLAVFDVPFAVWIFAAGALLAVVQAFLYALRNRSDNWREARLHRLNFVASLFLGIAAWFMYKENNAWVVMLLLYALLVLFLSFRGKK
ncbi:MAG: hypothetical protein NC038_06065 [Paludibacter sp.]|nr:hypothetical protein [Bacteroidales bacterium]MCM1069310.1 hypothetical protein [Prevotella sp.]MCM1353707.1 hypothetical protein [Bacteroides sp.]MCM1442225.1 hypothetical protein [Muribaculum sp.]MCM1482187.1 hypothetical protein [Paludibacter sp.]